MTRRELLARSASVSLLSPPSIDVLVYGATPAGIAAALAAGQDGSRVVLVEPTSRIGGLLTCGLSHSDFRTFEGITGAFHTFTRRVLAHYARTFGADSQQVKDCNRGTHAEPKVNLMVLEQMLAEQRTVEVRHNMRLTSVEVESKSGGRRVTSASFAGLKGARATVHAALFIDATYEGDLLAAAGVPYRTGRESRGEYGEPLAPEKADGQLQGYNFRFIATRDPANRVTPAQPAGYRREEFAGILPLLADGRIKRIFGYPGECAFKAQIPHLPNGKFDINDVSGGPVRLSLPGENLAWPEGSPEDRRRVFNQHLLWNVGLLWFLQNDEAVPARFRDEARQWGWCKDEFTETNHLPPQLYVREARRMTGLRVFTEKDTDHAPGDARAVLHRDSIAMGDYGPNCHGTAHEGSRFGGRHTGEFYKPVPPYQIPYPTLLPHDVENLLVPGAPGSSHVGFCALRLEPIWMSLGQAAGHAAHLARSLSLPVQKVPVARLQARLWRDRAATIYFSDISQDHPHFEAAQWWGTAGGFHGLAPMPGKAGPRGRNLFGQYYEAFPGHAAELDRTLDDATLVRWSELARQLQLRLPAGTVKMTRLQWIQALRREPRA